MNWIEFIIIALLLFGNLLALYLSSIAKRLGENNADILQNRLKEYEAEKGKNLATKEDIADITQKVEEVKSVVSLTTQSKFQKLAEQERILLGILYDATKIAQSQNKIILYFYDTSSRLRYDNLVETVNDTLAHFYHLSNLAVVSMNNDDVIQKIGDLSTATTYLAGQVSVAATNAASLVDQYRNQLDHAMKMGDDDKNKAIWLASGLQTKQQIEAMRGRPIDGRDKLDSAIEEYCNWLKELYGRDFFSIKNVM